MKTRYLIAVAIAGIIVIMMSAIHFFERPKSGDTAPPFILGDVSGNEVSLENQKGKIVFLHFWATWCDMCLSEIPAVEKLSHEFVERDIAVVTILVDDDGNYLDEIRKRTPLNYPILLDPGGSVADAYGVWGVPESFIIDRNGIILERSSSALRYDVLRKRIESSLAR